MIDSGTAFLITLRLMFGGALIFAALGLWMAIMNRTPEHSLQHALKQGKPK